MSAVRLHPRLRRVPNLQSVTEKVGRLMLSIEGHFVGNVNEGEVA